MLFGALTFTNYPLYIRFQHRQELMKNNADILKDIDTCMFVASLDDKLPKVNNDIFITKILLVRQILRSCSVKELID